MQGSFPSALMNATHPGAPTFALNSASRCSSTPNASLEGLPLIVGGIHEPNAQILQRMVERNAPGTRRRGICGAPVDVHAKHAFLAERVVKGHKLRMSEHRRSPRRESLFSLYD